MKERSVFVFLCRLFTYWLRLFNSADLGVYHSVLVIMKHKDGKPNYQNDKNSNRVVSLTVLLVVLCGFSFYLGGIFCGEKDRSDFKHVSISSVPSPKDSAVSPLQVKSVSFPECSTEYQDYTPCTDPKV